MEYKEFLKSKRHSSIDHGIDPLFIPNDAFDFQRFIIEKACRKGRYAVFLDTGLGKTLIELALAKNYLKHTGKPVLIITPLAVAFQFVKEAKKFNISGVSYSKDGKITSNIVVCNYERLNKFNPKDYECVILDESSILKNFDGAVKWEITEFLKKVKYRFLFTATPSPNSYEELGTSSEALGVLGYIDMLGMFFKNNQNSISSNDVRRVGQKWYLKPHARVSFWEWVNTWSISMRKPSDYGFNDDKFNLPDLKINKVVVKRSKLGHINGQSLLFNVPAVNFHEIRQEVRQTIEERCNKAVELSSGYDHTVYWTNLNDESKMIKSLDPDSCEIVGSMDIDKKEEILKAFTEGEIKNLVTKASITAYGLNWQHCNHTVYFPTFSYEQYYQAVRRFYRFGQLKKVFVDLVISDGQSRVVRSLLEKSKSADKMFDLLINNTANYCIAQNPSTGVKMKKPVFI